MLKRTISAMLIVSTLALPCAALATQSPDTAVSSAAAQPAQEVVSAQKAPEKIGDYTIVYSEDGFAEPIFQQKTGKITEVTAKGDGLRFAVDVFGEEYIVVAEKDVPTANDATQKAMSAAELKVGDSIRVWAEPIIAMSLPPVISAKGILKIADVTKGVMCGFYLFGTLKNGVLTDAVRSMEFSVTDDTKFVYAGEAKALTPGMLYFGWPEGEVNESYPEQGKAGTILAYDYGARIQEDTEMSTFAFIEGSVKAVSENKVTVTTKEGDVVLLISDNTAIADDATRKVSEKGDIKVGTKLRAWTSNASTRSIPPQTNACAVLLNTTDETVGSFYECGLSMAYAVDFESPEDGESYGGYELTDTDNSMIITTDPQTELTFACDKDKVFEGMGYFAWIDGPVALSLPGQARADDMIVFDNLHSGSVTLTEARDGTWLFVNGTRFAIDAYVKDGVTYVPLFKTAAALGYTTRWQAKTKRARLLTDGKEVFRAYVGKEAYKANGAEYEFENAPLMYKGRIYVEAEALAALGAYVQHQAKSGEYTAIGHYAH